MVSTWDTDAGAPQALTGRYIPCIDSCVVEWTENTTPTFTPRVVALNGTGQKGMFGGSERRSDVEDSRSTLKDGRRVWRQLGPHQMLLSLSLRSVFLGQDALLKAGGGAVGCGLGDGDGLDVGRSRGDDLIPTGPVKVPAVGGLVAGLRWDVRDL